MHSTRRWTTGLAAATLIAVPAAGFAQSTTSAPPTPPAQTAAPQTAAPKAPESTDTPAGHVRQAKEALSSIPAESLSVTDRAKVAQLRTHLDALDRAVVSPTAATAPRVVNGRTTAPANNWAADVAAIDKILTGMIGPETATSGATPTGTSGTAGALNDEARTQLQVVRRHVTELASAMSGTEANGAIASTTPRTDQPATAAVPTSSPDMTAAASQAAAAAAAGATSTTPPATAATTPPASATATPPASAATTPPASATATPPASASATPPASAATTPPASAAGDPAAAASQPPASGAQVDTAAAKQHLSEARDSLSQLTSLPEAAKLQGDARTQVSALISNFNELITTPVDWRASYAKVDGDLTTLLGPEAGQQGAPASATDATASGVAGATGTSGTTPAPSAQSTPPQLDPAIRAKLVEFRAHLKAFEQAAGGATPKTVQ